MTRLAGLARRWVPPGLAGPGKKSGAMNGQAVMPEEREKRKNKMYEYVAFILKKQPKTKTLSIQITVLFAKEIINARLHVRDRGDWPNAEARACVSVDSSEAASFGST